MIFKNKNHFLDESDLYYYITYSYGTTIWNKYHFKIISPTGQKIATNQAEANIKYKENLLRSISKSHQAIHIIQSLLSDDQGYPREAQGCIREG